MSRRRGIVYLVGAGPGDPGLITVRGADLLRCADAVVYDALAPSALVDLAPPHAARIDVGRRGHDPPTRTQEEISALLVGLAREGKTVVRLKGGDPFVFGRGGEEASACSAAGIPFEVVPGVSSAIASLAYAGIPVTDRRHASSFTVVTGHKDPTPSVQAMRWQAIAMGSDTLVVLMGLRNLRSILARLMELGRAPDTPSAAVMLGTTPRQRTVVAPLRELAQRVEESGLGSPSAIVVGEVVRLRDELCWFESRPLFGRRILVTRPEERSRELAALLRGAGAEAVVVPMIQLTPLPDLSPLDTALEKLGAYDAVLFSSRTAVRIFAESWQGRGAPGVELLCVGPATAGEAFARGLVARVVESERHDAEGMLETLRCEGPAGRRYLFLCAEGARDVLPEGLRRAGSHVDTLPLYRTESAAVDVARLRRDLIEGSFDALTFSSPSAVVAFAACLDDPSRRALAEGSVVAATGRATASALEREGFPAHAVARRSGDAALLEVLEEAFLEEAASAPEETP